MHRYLVFPHSSTIRLKIKLPHHIQTNSNSIIIIQDHTQMETILEKYHTPPPNYPLSQHAINGFSSSPSVAQIVSYLLISLSIAVYFTCVVAIHFNLALLTLYALLGTVLFVTTLLATVCDPTDRVVYYYKWSRHDKDHVFAPDYSKVLFCEFCDSYCMSTSKHCRSCNRCVNNFDHHCMWFNNCVGQRNYKYFFASILSSFAYLVVVIVHVAISSAYADYGNKTDLTKIVLSWVTASLLSIFAFLLLNLILLHIYLLASGQTTFTFLQRKKKEDEKDKSERQRMNVSKSSIIPMENRVQIQEEEIVSKQNIVIMGKHTQKVSSSLQPGRKVSNQFFSNAQGTKKESKDQKIQEEQSEGNQTIGQKSIPSFSEIENNAALVRESSNDLHLQSEEGQEHLPPFLRKNKSLRLLLSQTQAQIPSKRPLQPNH